MIPSPSPTIGDTDPDATISTARDGWPTPPELACRIERLLPHAAGYWHGADNLIGLLNHAVDRSGPHRTAMGPPDHHKPRKIPGMGTWLAVEWLRSLGEGHAVNEACHGLIRQLPPQGSRSHTGK